MLCIETRGLSEYRRSTRLVFLVYIIPDYHLIRACRGAPQSRISLNFYSPFWGAGVCLRDNEQSLRPDGWSEEPRQ